MRTNNKMKDCDVESEEWWEVAKEQFVKECEKNLIQHRTNERNLKYKLEIYQKEFPKFICGSPINTKASCQNEETKTRPSGTAQEEEM
jgi:hypothetical protein